MARVSGTEKYSFTILHGGENTVLQYYRGGENLGNNHVITNPILLTIPYIKNLAVRRKVTGKILDKP